MARRAVCCDEGVDFELTRAVRVVGWLHVATGATMLIAPLFAFQASSAYGGAAWLPPQLWLVTLGVAVLATGVGLLRRQRWAWGLALLIALSGAAVTSGRLWFDGPGQGVIAALITNLIVLAVLVTARRRRRAGPPTPDPA